MRALARVATIVVLAGAALMVTFQLLDGPARYVIVSGHSMEPTLRTGDLALVVRHASYRRGEVVAYRVPDGQPGAGGIVIHRVIGGSDSAGYVTKGDNRQGRDIWRPKPDDVIGSTAFQIPRAGVVPMSLGTPMGLGLGAGLLAFFLLSGGGKGRRGEDPTELRPQPECTSPVTTLSVAGSITPAAHAGPSPLLVATAGVALGGLVLVAARRARSRHVDR